MERERPHCLTGRKITGIGAACAGVFFCLALIAFIAYIFASSYSQIISEALILGLVLNIISTIIWLLGCIKEKKEFMFGALICWGSFLNVWLGYIFYKTIIVVPYGPELHRHYSTAEIVIPSITVLFVFFYIIMMFIYNSFGKDIGKLFSFDWKIYGIISGWTLIALSIGQTMLFYSQRFESDFYYYGTILFFILNTVAAITFLYGLFKNKKLFVLTSLVCWVIPLSIWIGLIIYGITQRGYNPGGRRRADGYNPIYSISVFYMILYAALCFEFKSMTVDSRSNTGRFNVSYASPPTAKKSDA